VKKVIAALFASALFLSGCSSSEGVSDLGARDFISQSQVEGVVLIDVRTPEEFSEGHIAGAMNIDVQSPTFDSEIASLDKSVTYALYCRSGNRSGIAAGKMSDAGFISILNAQVGYADLVNAGAVSA
jgi:phage shock protein E